MSLGLQELLVVLFIVLLLFGASRVPKLARSLGEAATELRRALGNRERRGEVGQPRSGTPEVADEPEHAAGE